MTVNCTLFQGESAEEVADFMNDMMELGVEGVTISQDTPMSERLVKMSF